MKGRREIIIDWIQEASVLIGVFPVLDKLLTGTLSKGWLVWPLSISAGLLLLCLLLTQPS